jgi:hypothetical protein
LLEFVVRLVVLPAVGAQGVVELLAGMNLHKQGRTASAGPSAEPTTGGSLCHPRASLCLQLRW